MCTASSPVGAHHEPEEKKKIHENATARAQDQNCATHIRNGWSLQSKRKCYSSDRAVESFSPAGQARNFPGKLAREYRGAWPLKRGELANRPVNLGKKV